MLVVCKECQGKARIASREKLSIEFAKLYCMCLEKGCGHQFVMNLTFSHTTRPAAGAIDQLLFDRLRDLSKTQQRQLFDQLDTLPAL